MRVLFLSTPQASHVFPMVAFAWAVRAAGHDVLVATTGPALAVSGALPTVDFGPPDPTRAEAMPALAADQTRLVYSRLTKVAEGWPVLAHVASMFAEPMISVAESWRPDVIVHSQLQGAGLLAAARVGVPAVEHGFGLLRTENFYDRLPDLLPETVTRLGVTPGAVRRAAIDVAPPSMVAGHDGAWLSRFVPYNGAGVLPSWLAEPPARPRIAVTVGSMATAGDPGADPYLDDFVARLYAAAPHVDAELVLLGMAPRHLDAGDLPLNVRAVRGWLPLRELLDSCSAIVHQGGAGTSLNALHAGIPQLTIPVVAPNYMHSRAIEGRGVGWWIELEKLDAAAFGRLLADDSLRAAAAEVRREIATTPPPSALVSKLEGLVTTLAGA